MTAPATAREADFECAVATLNDPDTRRDERARAEVFIVAECRRARWVEGRLWESIEDAAFSVVRDTDNRRIEELEAALHEIANPLVAMWNPPELMQAIARAALAKEAISG